MGELNKDAFLPKKPDYGIGSLWRQVVATFTGTSAKPADLKTINRDRQSAAATAQREKEQRGEYGQAMTPWGELTIYDPTDPRFRSQVEDTWKAHRKTYKGKSGQRTGLARWEVSSRMNREWAETLPPVKVKRDRNKAIRDQAKHKYETGQRPNRTPERQQLIEDGLVLPKKYQVDAG